MGGARDLFRFDAHYVEAQHLAGKRLIDHSRDDLLPIRRGGSIVDLAVIAVGDADDNRRSRSYGDGLFKIFLIDFVPYRRIVLSQ